MKKKRYGDHDRLIIDFRGKVWKCYFRGGRGEGRFLNLP